ncbi:uncharacterized protein LOC131063509 isoform X1 [Cryptomeria japonica]|uniref:uncharacterized protein LOC131063509 isoform X1 n=1 Tax=Cryptomeria japonica TaxID=3369 RepID=UPI0027DA0F9F|nr:uncharacterized protein LOC131063509 isoform X1 [Cryptomeria japonica]
MAITNFLMTVIGVGAVVLLLRSDVKQSANIFKRNMKQIRTWIEEESSATASKRSIQGSKQGIIGCRSCVVEAVQRANQRCSQDRACKTQKY